ncbi:MAG: S41 family peptidase [Myxococcota bacterium]
MMLSLVSKATNAVRLALLAASLAGSTNCAPTFEGLAPVPADKLERDFEVLRQGLEQFHTGLYRYTSKESYDREFDRARRLIDGPMNEREFFRVVAPVVTFAREGHSGTRPSEGYDHYIRTQAPLLPVAVWIRSGTVYCTELGSPQAPDARGASIVAINQEAIADIVTKLRRYIPTDGFIESARDHDLGGLTFAWLYHLEYGPVERFELTVATDDGEQTHWLDAVPLPQVEQHIEELRISRGHAHEQDFEYRVLSDDTAYLGVQTFSTISVPQRMRYRRFLRRSFRDIAAREIETLIIDVSRNGGGNEGNENLLFSYLANNYRKYRAVRAKTNLAVLDNGLDDPIELRAFGLFERLLFNEQQPDGSYERRADRGHGLTAYRNEPRIKYRGELYVLIGPKTYSGGSEFANMIRARNRGVFVGEETGGGYYGNTSGYMRELTLPHSGLRVIIPALLFDMNVEGPTFGRGVMPDHRVVPTIDQVLEGSNPALDYVLADLKSPRD